MFLFFLLLLFKSERKRGRERERSCTIVKPKDSNKKEKNEKEYFHLVQFFHRSLVLFHFFFAFSNREKKADKRSEAVRGKGENAEAGFTTKAPRFPPPSSTVRIILLLKEFGG